MNGRWIRVAWASVLLAGCMAGEVGGVTLASSGDADGDGDPDGTDCAPFDPSIHSAATEVCNDVDDDCDMVVDEPVGDVYCVDTRSAPTWADQCPVNVQVGRLSTVGAPCPEPGGGWTKRDLFTRGMTGRGGLGYCVYEHPDPLTADVTQLPSEGGRAASDWLRPDCLAMTPLGSGDAEAASALVWESYFDGWLAQLEAEPTLPSPGVTPGAVHVAVLDSAPPSSGFSSPAASDRGALSHHGAAMGLLVQHLACPAGRGGGTCLADFTNHTALASTAGGGDAATEGGEIGTFAQVAMAMEEAAIDGAMARTRGGVGLPLVFVLSIGAEPLYAASAIGPRPAADALRDAIENVVCDHDAIVFAATGNRSGGPSPSVGPVIPAAWAADATRCGRPFVVPVGGVDPGDQPIRRARDGALPELVAPARSVVVDLARGLGPAEPTPLMTGTSFGPVAAAAAAAMIWSYAPSLTASQVVAELYDSATPLTLGPADFCAPGTTCRDARRVSVCGALLRAQSLVCPSSAPICGHSFACSGARVAAGAGSPVVLDAATRAALPGSGAVDATGMLPDSVTSLTCPGVIQTNAALLSTRPDLCPEQQYPMSGAGPAFGPQPGGNTGCRVCALDPSNGELVMYINEDFSGTLYPPVLVTSEGDKLDLSAALPSGPLSLGEEYELENLGVDGDSEWAVLYFTVVQDGKKYSQMEEIEIW